ncbi:hypothetical protein KP509_08G024700 [Ceratopteris richardii]|uniref:Nudix hydrolase domain-containing protein n=1 Tax=Ceratopteris richardii TaxID=49495 RepID=A0A8T2UAV2_CERRI|nr:hypothetical protein KP509_08G024700 [Ceratopteris richardii]
MPSKLLSKLYSSELFVKGEWGSERMRQLAEQLIVYRRPLNFLGRDEDDEGDDCGSGEAGAEGVSSTCGIPEETVKFIHRLPPDVGKKKAAVLVCLFYDEHDELRVLLTRRSKLLSTHSGEVAFPGGKRDEMDANNIETALREAWEEIGLDSSLVRVVTYLEPFLSKHLLRVTPVMALVPDRSKLSLTPNKGEVDAIFDAPLRMFLKVQYLRLKNDFLYCPFYSSRHVRQYHLYLMKILKWRENLWIFISVHVVKQSMWWALAFNFKGFCLNIL